MNYYVLEIYRDVQPILHGPFPTDTERDDCCERLRKSDSSCRNGYFPLCSDTRIQLE